LTGATSSASQTTPRRWPKSPTQAGVTGFGIAAVAQAHELGAKFNSSRGTNCCHAVAEIIHFPREMYFSAAVRLVARHDQRAVSRCRIKARH
jgi:hypothetical protein